MNFMERTQPPGFAACGWGGCWDPAPSLMDFKGWLWHEGHGGVHPSCLWGEDFIPFQPNLHPGSCLTNPGNTFLPKPPHPLSRVPVLPAASRPILEKQG